MRLPFGMTRANAAPLLAFTLRENWRQFRSRLAGGTAREERALSQVLRCAPPNDPEAALAALDDFASKSRFLMNVGREKGQVLEDALRETPGRRAVEFGAYCGYSALLVAHTLRERDGSLVSVEPSPEFARITRKVIAHAGLGDRVRVLEMTAAEAISDLEGPIDLLFLDHSKEDYLDDLRAVEKAGLLIPGSAVVADNVGIFGDSLEPYLDHVRRGGAYESVYTPGFMEYSSIPDGVEVSIRL